MIRRYYAGGREVGLEPESDRVAIHAGDRAKLPPAVQRAVEGGARMPNGIVVVARDAIPAAALRELAATGVAQTIYRHGDATAIPLPEVRVEFDDAAERGRVATALRESPVEVDVVEEDDSRLVLRPRSGRGDDALDLASFVFERAHPAAASPRMVQIVRRPGAK